MLTRNANGDGVWKKVAVTRQKKNMKRAHLCSDTPWDAASAFFFNFSPLCDKPCGAVQDNLVSILFITRKLRLEFFLLLTFNCWCNRCKTHARKRQLFCFLPTPTRQTCRLVESSPNSTTRHHKCILNSLMIRQFLGPKQACLQNFQVLVDWDLGHMELTKTLASLI